MLKKLLVAGLFVCSVNAQASCVVQSILHDGQVNALVAGKYVDFKTNHAYQIFNDSGVIQNYWICRKMFLKNTSGTESFQEEACFAVSLKPLKTYSVTLPLIKPVHFTKKGDYVGLTITTKTSVDCAAESVVNKVLKVN